MTDTHDGEPEHHLAGLSNRLNWLRAGVLGANDGIVSVAGIVLGVAAASTDRAAILTAGVAGLLAGALSMAAGEYVSVSTQRDSERALLAKEKWELQSMPDAELVELAEIYQNKGLPPELAMEVAEQLTKHDALRAHAEAELGINPDELTNPWQAATASSVSFTVGALLPLLVIMSPVAVRAPACFVAVLVALAITGAMSARLGGAKVARATIRTVAGGALAMAVTYGVGHVLGVAL